MNKSWFVYIIECSDGCLYTGITTDVERRFREHQGLEGKNRGAKFFRGRRAIRVGFIEPHETRSAASKREIQIKRMSASMKKTLLSQN